MRHSYLTTVRVINVKHRMAVVAVVLAVALGASARANAAPLDGKWAGSVPACSSNSHIGSYQNNRIKAWNPLALGGGADEDYGWFEWRYSRNGSCNGYQWVRLHIEHAITIYGGGWLGMVECRNTGVVCVYPQIRPQEINVQVRGPNWFTTASVLEPGTYDGALLYSPDSLACSYFSSQALVSNWDLFTSAPIKGNICG